MGVLSQRGKLVLDFWFRGRRCREYLQVYDTPENRKTWERKLRLIKAQIENGTFDYRAWFPVSPRLKWFYPDQAKTNALTVGDYLEAWHKMRSPFRSDGTLVPDAEYHPTTWIHDQGTIRRHLQARIGHIALRDLQPQHIRELRIALQEKLKGKTVQNIIGLLSTALEDAVLDREIEINPIPRSKRRRRRRDLLPGKRDPFVPEEVDLILASLPKVIKLRDGAEIDGETLYDVFRLWSLTGWRPNELVALRFDWIDFRTRTVAILKGRSPRGGGLEARPKNDEREVHLDFAPWIFEMFERRKRAALATGKRDYVFTDSLGRPLNQEMLGKRVWNPTLRKLGIRVRGPYNLRHTAASTMLEAGETPGFVAHVLGTTEAMIWKHYRKYIKALRSPDAGRAFYERMMQRAVSANVSADDADERKVPRKSTGGEWRRGELNPRKRELRSAES